MFLIRMIHIVQERDLEGRPPRSVEDLEQYGENTSASLLYLTLESCGVRHPAADEAAR